MPEGDTLYNLALRLGPHLLGRVVTEARGRRQGRMDVAVGERVEAVRAIGKNLVLDLTHGWSFRVHLGIAGRCRRYEASQRRWPPPQGASLVVVTDDGATLVVERARDARLMRSAHVRAAPGIAGLGPDLIREGADLTLVMALARATGNQHRGIGELLLDQRVAAGIGNVFRCEVLFLEALDPWLPVGQLSDARLRSLYERAHALLLDNRATPDTPGRPRTTGAVAGEAHWVYRRTGRPCLRCGATVDSRRQGEQARTVYWCPRCQPSVARP